MTINGEIKSEIGKGYLILIGIGEDDGREDADWLVKRS